MRLSVSKFVAGLIVSAAGAGKGKSSAVDRVLYEPSRTDRQLRGFHVGFGIGLASGPATVGRIGYKDRLDYTAIGSVVNLAARLCASAADKEILVDAKVAAEVAGKRSVEHLGGHEIKGFGEAILVSGISFDAS